MKKLKSYFFSALFTMICGAVYAQPSIIQSLQIIPAQPSPTDSVYVVVEAMISSTPCGIQNFQINTSGAQITADVHYQAGMLPAICTTTDTILLGTFSPGQYQLTYNATDASYSQVFDSATGSFTVLGCVNPSAGFVFQAQNLTVTFQNQSQTLGSTSYLWDFDDQNTDTALNPVHQFATDGAYNVCLSVQDSCGVDTLCQQILVSCNLPSADFVFSNQSFRDVVFTSSVSGADSILWDFKDGSTSTQNNLTHTFADTGTFLVCLYAFNECGIDTVCKEVVIQCDFPEVSFVEDTEFLTVELTSSVSVADTFYWDFGDGTTSGAANPTKTYDTTGVYRVCLIAQNACGTDSACQNITAVCAPTVADFEYISSSPAEVSFTNLSMHADSLLWDFGTGDSSTLSDPLLTGITEDTLNVCLIAYGMCFNDTLCKEVVPLRDINSVHELYNDENIKIYPIPADRHVNVMFNALPSNAVIDLYDASGKHVRSINAVSRELSVPVSDLSPGVYMLRVSGSDQKYTKKIVISNR